MVDYVVSEQVIKDLVIGFENIGTRFEKLDTRIDSLEEGQQYIHKDVSFLQDDFMKRISELEVRISRLETTRTVTEGGVVPGSVSSLQNRRVHPGIVYRAG